MLRAAAIIPPAWAPEAVGGHVLIHPNAKTGAHHHGAPESVIMWCAVRRACLGERLNSPPRRSGRFHFRAAVRAASGDQCAQATRRSMRAGTQRQRVGGGQPQHRCGGTSRGGLLARPRFTRQAQATASEPLTAGQSLHEHRPVRLARCRMHRRVLRWFNPCANSSSSMTKTPPQPYVVSCRAWR